MKVFYRKLWLAYMALQTAGDGDGDQDGGDMFASAMPNFVRATTS